MIRERFPKVQRFRPSGCYGRSCGWLSRSGGADPVDEAGWMGVADTEKV